MSSPFFMVLMRSLFHLPLQSIRAAEQLQVQIKQTWLGSWVKPASDEFAKIVPTSYTNNISLTTGSWATLQPGESLTLKAAIIPTDMSEQVINVTFKTSDGDTKIETYGKEFKAGVIYNFNKSMGWDGSGQEVDGLSEFKFRAVNNCGLYQDVVFTRQSDNSYMTTVVPEVDLSNIVPTFDYNGKVTIDGIDVYNDKTAINFRAEIGKLSMWLSTRINLYNTVVDNM